MRADLPDSVRHCKRLAQRMAGQKRDCSVVRLGPLRFAQKLRVRQQERLAPPAKPEIAIEPRFVKVGIKLRHYAPRIPERREESNLRCSTPGGADFGENLQHCQVIRLVGRLVGDVKDDEVNACVRQHLRVAADDISIVSQVVAEL